MHAGTEAANANGRSCTKSASEFDGYDEQCSAGGTHVSIRSYSNLAPLNSVPGTRYRIAYNETYTTSLAVFAICVSVS